MKELVNHSTPGVTAAMASRHCVTPRAALRASWHACAEGYRHSSTTLFSIPAGSVCGVGGWWGGGSEGSLLSNANKPSTSPR